jgi:biotin synthase
VRFDTLVGWLRETDPARLDALRAEADAVRRAHVGDAVHLRGLVEISSHCVRHCGYCGLRAERVDLPRYRLAADEIAAVACQARDLGYGTVVLQAGEDPGLTREGVADVVRRVKAETGLAVTLSLGERSPADLEAWRAAGADRYLLRFETSNPALYRTLHPRGPASVQRRLQRLRAARRLGYEIGSGVMVGLPGQTWHDVARDLLTFAELDLDMIGLGPWIPHPGTPAANLPPAASPGEQVPNDAPTTLKVLALARRLCPDANLPATTALATVDPVSGREDGLRWGANVLMPDLTPVRYRAAYEIYPGKACVGETPEQCHGCLQRRIAAIGRTVGTGRGDSASLARRKAVSSSVHPSGPGGPDRPPSTSGSPAPGFLHREAP